MPMPIGNNSLPAQYSPVGGGLSNSTGSGQYNSDPRFGQFGNDAITAAGTAAAVVDPVISGSALMIMNSLGLLGRPDLNFYVNPQTGQKMNFGANGPADRPATPGAISPVTTKAKSFNPGINRGPFGSSPLMNPYGQGGPGTAEGRSEVFGGQNDLLKSIATRDIAVQGLMSGLQRPDMPNGLSAALQNGAGMLGGKLGSEEWQNISPGIQRGFTQYGDQYRNQLAGLLNSAYTLGGGLWGGAESATAIAKNQNAMRKMRQIQSVQGIIGGAIGGLTGGGGGGMGGGGGGGGGGAAGIGDIVSGAYGAASA